MELSDEELLRWAERLSGRVAIEQAIADQLRLLLDERGIPIYTQWDPVHDIAAAWELFLRLSMPCGIERGYERTYGVGPLGVWVGFGALPPEHDEDDVWAENVWAETAPLAITRAWVLAMEGK